MTAKQFFKSTAFKCIVTLLCVLLVCGIFLTIMHGLLEVTAEEKFQRILSDIYGKSVTTTEQDLSDKNTNLSSAVINNVYKVEDDGNYLVKASGKNGYGGSVLCWVVIIPSSDKKSVGGVGNVKAPVADNPAESFLNNISSSMLEKFSKDYKDGIVYSYGFDDNGNEGENYIKTDASYSMRGICNAVNGTIQFMNAFLSGGDIVEEDPYEDFLFREYISMDDTSWAKIGTEVTYSVVTKGFKDSKSYEIDIVVDETKTIKTFTVTKVGATAPFFETTTASNIAEIEGKNLDYFIGIFGEDMEFTSAGAGNLITAGASYSSYLCMYAGAFALANYDYVMSLKSYTEYINLDNTTATVENGKVVYSISTKGLTPVGSFEIEVTVNGEGIIETFTITKNGSTAPYFETTTNTNIADIEGKDLTYFTDLFGKDMAYPEDDSGKFVTTGASRSSFLCMYAAAFATANYSSYLSDGGEANE